MPRLALPAALFLVAAASVVSADEVSDKQKAAAVENLKKADLKGYTVVESATLILVSPLPEARAKAVAEGLEKTAKTARKGLQYADKDEAWKGKLTVYHVPDRRAYGNFLRLVVGERSEAGVVVSVRGDEPLAATGVETNPKATDVDLVGEIGPAVGAAFLQSKAGPSTPLPPWVSTAYGRAASLRADSPTGKRMTTYKTAARPAVLGKGRGPATLAELWANDRPDAELVATAFVDYLAFGADKTTQERFPRFVSALRPDENGDTPEPWKALETAGWKAPELEAAWRTWAQKGMLVK
ncbi:MAG TPA: hypothetical protein VD866_10650 [Urbifossiella sp.]|nr:hypothetical protein [Urbifossiella sp.]